MFKGINERDEKELQKNNGQGSNYFVFSFVDLELIEKDGNRRKCLLSSDELSNKLHQIYSEGKSDYIPPIKFIDFELVRDNDNLFPNDHDNYFYFCL